ncbi:MAG: amino acid permease, partial [Selenomonadaceae bacterium]|nr:amino acid permease [Selenomonadaceae bacterium]
EVYLGEALLSLSALWIFGFLCIRGGKFAAYVQTISAFILLGGVIIGFGAVLSEHGLDIFNIEPPFAPNMNHISAIFGIVVLAPWAFAGFESISQSTEGFKFSTKKTFTVLFFAVLTSALVYIFLGIIAISSVPKIYGNWYQYINDINSLEGLSSLPTFFAIDMLMGKTGLIILAVTVVAAVITGLVGNYIAASRLIYALTKDNLLPLWFGKLNTFNNPRNAIFFIMLLSIPIPFLGRTAISWIIDVNTIGATIDYAYTSAVTFILAKRSGYLKAQFTGAFGIFISVIFFLYFMVPSFWIISAMSTESYMILIFWSILGFAFFRYIFQRDTRNRFGKSTVVWMALLFLIFFTSTMWLRQTNHVTTESVLNGLNDYYVEELSEHGIVPNEIEKNDAAYYLESQMEFVNESLRNSNFMQISIIVITLFIMFNIYNLMMRREKDMEIQKVEAEQSSRAKSTFLSNMSHDIRTPMNAIIGYTTLLKKEKNLPPQATEYLDKIEASNKHLLALINDILDMSRIESGKMELDPIKANLVKTMDEVRDLFATQMITKSITYVVSTENVTNKMVMCDTPRLNRVLLNLISNAYKFTPEGGRVSVTLSQVGATEETGSYELSVKDTGMGMTPEFAKKVFEAYSRDRTVNNIQGTGLGMAITKSIVELMGGTIEVKTEYGKGTEFIVHVDFPLVEDVSTEKNEQNEAGTKPELDFSNMKLLLVEDNMVNREIASLILTEYGFMLDTAENGKEAVNKVAASKPGDYQAVLMDIQMPVMNGYEATKAIRALNNPELANIPIIAMTANAFKEDIQAAKDAGMNSHIAKPIDIPQMLETLTEVLK